MNLVLVVQSVRAERGANNLSCAQDSPPVSPAQLVKLSPRMLAKCVLAPHCGQLVKLWTEEWIDDVESIHRLIRITYDEDEELRSVIDKYDLNKFFDEAWGISHGGRFDCFRAICGGLATAFASTSSVESDFSILVVNESKSHVLSAPLADRHHPDETAGCSGHVYTAHGTYINHVMEIHDIVSVPSIN